MGRVLLVCALGVLSACIDRAPFACEEDVQCQSPERDGRCVAPGYCAHPDERCPSGLRFGRFAAPALVGQCIEVEDESTGASSTGSSSTSGGSSSSDGGSTTGTTAGSSSSGDPLPTEECDGIDNDGDGLIDEWSPLNEECSGCTLLQRQGYAYWVCGGGRWTDLQPQCSSFGANLASIHDAEENLFLALMVPGGATWIGLNDIGNETVFTWVDGSPVGYTNWTNGVPPGENLGSNCVGINTQGEWSAFNCTNSRPGFCKAPHPD
ncbi:C-type lectin domain-containing protein [Paraliomyxa miuraensis]|uniref:C-type lectin domain-containing protein n=1 Tax=Paraliomyxa miuraensis TaxID=376150 RepID=UPI00224CEED6|nr:C-type lectin domain-containing protein [Paraliomyxa miuraensis]MCX4247984.1 C-type lectin domain-containing protein [Paraliomyxa miuraensis]